MHDLRQAEFPDVTRPALRVALLSRLEDFPALRQDALGLAVMALTRRDVAKGTVPVLMVVPLGKLLNPVLSLGQGSEPLGAGKPGRYLSVLKADSAKALSLLTRGRLYDGVMPRS